jgi:fatty-acyl-CoA synthase
MNWQVAAAAIGVLAMPLEPMLVSLGKAGLALRVRAVVCAVYLIVLAPLIRAAGLNGAGAPWWAPPRPWRSACTWPCAEAGGRTDRLKRRTNLRRGSKRRQRRLPMITPTSSSRTVRFADFPTLTAALDFAATGETGINLYSLRGELVEALPYAKLREQALALAPRLLATGAKPGDSVGLIADTEADFVRAFFACQYAGLVPAPLPLPAPLGGREAYVEQIARMLGSAHAKLLIGPAGMKDWVAEIAAKAPLDFAGVLADLPRADSAAGLPEILPDNTCYLQFSSGSTRFPTGVLVTHRALMANAVAITRDGLQVRPSDRAVSWLPLYHDMGLIGFLLAPMTSQMSVDLLPTGAFVRRPLLWLDLITKNGGTISYSPTFGYELCARRAEVASIEHLDLSNWRSAGLGGDMIRTGPLKAFAERFASVGFSDKAFVASYGMAEATLALSMAPLGGGLKTERLDVERLEQHEAVVTADAERSREFARNGPALPGHELEVRDENGAGAARARRGPHLRPRPQPDAGIFRAAAGDRPRAVGRRLAGHRRPGLPDRRRDRHHRPRQGPDHPQRPQHLAAGPGMDRRGRGRGLRSGDVAAFSVPGDGEETVVVLVQARGGDADTRAALVEKITGVLRLRHQVETQVQLVGAHALPQTSSGKLSRSKAKAAYLAGAYAATERA